MKKTTEFVSRSVTDNQILALASKEEVVIIITRPLFVRQKARHTSQAVHQLYAGVYVKVLTSGVFENAIWMRVPSGWMRTVDGEGDKCYDIVADVEEGERSWTIEAAKRKRMASAVTAMLVRAHPLPKAKRFVRTILKHATTFYPEKPILKLNAKCIEDIMIELNGI